MINSLNKYDVIVVKFPFASSMRYKARPAVLISSEDYHRSGRNTSIILAISSQVDAKLTLEPIIMQWQTSGLLKPSILKASIATIENDFIISKLGTLSKEDQIVLDQFIQTIC